MAGTATISTIKHDVTGAATTFRDGAGNEIGQLTKAWVNFNGVSGAASRASFGVSSLSRSSTGVYTVTATNAFSDSNYSCVFMWGGTAAIAAGRTYEDTTPRTSSSITIVVVNSSMAVADAAYISVNFNR